jgi:hypothetical protein
MYFELYPLTIQHVNELLLLEAQPLILKNNTWLHLFWQNEYQDRVVIHHVSEVHLQNFPLLKFLIDFADIYHIACHQGTDVPHQWEKRVKIFQEKE